MRYMAPFDLGTVSEMEPVRRVYRLFFTCLCAVVVLLHLWLPGRIVAEEPVVLFDGSSLAAWRGYGSEEPPPGWVIREGALYRASGGGDIMTRDTFEDFELAFEWKIAAGGNSGVMYRVREGDPAAYYSGPEYQLLDSLEQRDEAARLTAAGALYALYPSPPGIERPTGEWNLGRIVVQGNRIQHWLNGQKIVDCEIGSEDWNQRLDASKFAEWSMFAKERSGHVVLQDHGDPVWFRDIRITRLSTK